MSNYWNKLSPLHGTVTKRQSHATGGRVGLRDRAFAKGGRVGLKKGDKVKKQREYPGKASDEQIKKGGKKGIFQKVKEGISRKIRGKEKTEHKGLEQDVKTGAYTHKAPKDRSDTAPGRYYWRKIARGPHLRPGTKVSSPPSSNDMSWPKRKKQIEKKKTEDAKEKKRKDAWEKKYVKKYKRYGTTEKQKRH
tara:strand:+ start:93 stop:668 length:576 start_codon:yes stop_codon:yes gene_type:complete